jgi:hypothetical protein
MRRISRTTNVISYYYYYATEVTAGEISSPFLIFCCESTDIDHIFCHYRHLKPHPKKTITNSEHRFKDFYL